MTATGEASVIVHSTPGMLAEVSTMPTRCGWTSNVAAASSANASTLPRSG